MPGSFFNIFKKQPDSADYSAIGADMHSHLIPGIDDGAKTMEDSLMLIRKLYALGYRKLITTPHIMSDYFKNTPEIIFSGLADLRAAVKKENIEIEINAAAEYYLDDGFVHKLENEKLLTIGENYLLFEVSYINCPDNLKEIIFRMQILGYKPVLAHPERYPFWFNKFDEYREFKELGVLLQINTISLAGYYGNEAKKTAEKLIDNDMVDMAGTDMHHLKHADALLKTGNEKYFKLLLEKNLLNKFL